MNDHKFNHTFHACGVDYVEMGEVKYLIESLTQENQALKREGEALCRSIYNNCYFKDDDKQMYCEAQIRHFMNLLKQ